MKALAAVLAALVLSVACGSPSDSNEAGGGGTGAGGSGDNPVSGSTPRDPDAPVNDDPYDRDKDCQPGVMVDEGDDPDDAVTHQPCPEEPGPGEPKFQLVEPYDGGVTDVRAASWERAMRGDDDRTYRLIYWSGVEPCNVLDRVEVEATDRKVIATIYEGAAADQRDALCIEIAVQKAVEITLDEPLGDRKLVDGAPNE